MKFFKIIPALFALLMLAGPAFAVDAIIKDPNGTAARVNGTGQLTTKSIVETQLTNTSQVTGRAFTWSSTFATGGTGIESISIRNDATDKELHFDQIWIACAAACTNIVGHLDSGTPAGTTITGNPLNHDLSRVAEATAFGDASVTGSIVVDAHAHLLAPAGQSVLFDLEGAWIFGKDDTFVIQTNTNTTVYITVIGHFDDIE